MYWDVAKNDDLLDLTGQNWVSNSKFGLIGFDHKDCEFRHCSKRTSARSHQITGFGSCWFHQFDQFAENYKGPFHVMQRLEWVRGWWFGILSIFHISRIVIPTIFQRGWNHQPGFFCVNDSNCWVTFGKHHQTMASGESCFGRPWPPMENHHLEEVHQLFLQAIFNSKVWNYQRAFLLHRDEKMRNGAFLDIQDCDDHKDRIMLLEDLR